jgi:glycosyltransferase involved in cell wall biosynthesis
MQVLFISRHFPHDTHSLVHGVFKRMSMFIDAIKEIAHLDMLFYVRPDMDVSPSTVSALERSLSRHWNAKLRLFLCPRLTREGTPSKWRLYGAGVSSFFRQAGYMDMSGPPQVQALEACLRHKPDVVFAHRLASMCPLLLTREILPPIYFDLDDIEHVAFLRRISRRAKWRTKLLYYSHVPALWWGEYRAIRLAWRTFVCSELDRSYLKNCWRLPGVVTVPNTIISREVWPLPSGPTLLFLGSYSHRPNIDAAEYLIQQIWPHVYRAMPEARLIIAGALPERIEGYDIGVPGVEFTGFVDDLDALYQRSRVVCAPILSGSGTRVKIVEAAAYGKPMVATRLGAEGLDMQDDEELMLRDDAVSFAEACLKLLKDDTLCKQLGAAARAKAVRCYDRVEVVRLIQRYLRNEMSVVEPLQSRTAG